MPNTADFVFLGFSYCIIIIVKNISKWSNTHRPKKNVHAGKCLPFAPHHSWQVCESRCICKAVVVKAWLKSLLCPFIQKAGGTGRAVGVASLQSEVPCRIHRGDEMVTSPSIRIIGHITLSKRKQHKGETSRLCLLYRMRSDTKTWETEAGPSMPGFSLKHVNVWRYNFLNSAEMWPTRFLLRCCLVFIIGVVQMSAAQSGEW